MKRTHDGRNRRSIRLTGFDYTTCGAYFVTICTHARDNLLGEVSDGVMILNDCGRVLARIWARTVTGGMLPEPYEFVVMPNHVHGIAWLPRRRRPTRWPIDVGAQRPSNRDDVSVRDDVAESVPRTESVDAAPLQHHVDVASLGLPAPGSLGALVRSFKSTAAKAVNGMRGTPGLPVWQQRYHERIVRNERELAAIRQYILANPTRWGEDPNNVG